MGEIACELVFAGQPEREAIDPVDVRVVELPLSLGIALDHPLKSGVFRSPFLVALGPSLP